MKLGVWNITGLQSKIEVAEFVKTFDIIGVVETFGTFNGQFNVSGYKFFEKVRKISRRAVRNSGGICVFVKSELFKPFDIRELSSSSANIIWLKISSKVSDLIYDFIIDFVYISPKNSSIHSQEDVFTIIESDMISLKHTFEHC